MRVSRYAGGELEKQPLRGVVDELGRLSATAQNLAVAITTFERCLDKAIVLYVIFEESTNKALGMLKIGRKNLYLIDPLGQDLKRVEQVTCVLDFYVKRQREGLGRILFDSMLKGEKVEASQLALDRPSGKLIAFMSKNYGLSRFRAQANKFVVFDEFWTKSIS